MRGKPKYSVLALRKYTLENTDLENGFTYLKLLLDASSNLNTLMTPSPQAVLGIYKTRSMNKR